MREGKKRELGLHGVEAAKEEASEPSCFLPLTEDGLDDCFAHAIEGASGGRPEGVAHPIVRRRVVREGHGWVDDPVLVSIRRDEQLCGSVLSRFRPRLRGSRQRRPT